VNLSWFETTALALRIRDSLMLTASLSAMHLLGVTLVGGSAMFSGLRLTGLLLRDQPIETILRPAGRTIAVGLCLAMGTGVLLVLPRLSGAVQNEFFRWKMAFLAAAVLSQWAGFRRLSTGRPSRGIALVTSSACLAIVVAGAAFILWE
jgi:hypothetical protein